MLILIIKLFTIRELKQPPNEEQNMNFNPKIYFNNLDANPIYVYPAFTNPNINTPENTNANFPPNHPPAQPSDDVAEKDDVINSLKDRLNKSEKIIESYQDKDNEIRSLKTYTRGLEQQVSLANNYIGSLETQVDELGREILQGNDHIRALENQVNKWQQQSGKDAGDIISLQIQVREKADLIDYLKQQLSEKNKSALETYTPVKTASRIIQSRDPAVIACFNKLREDEPGAWAEPSPSDDEEEIQTKPSKKRSHKKGTLIAPFHQSNSLIRNNTPIDLTPGDQSIPAAVHKSSTAIQEWVVPNQQRRLPSSMTEYRLERTPANDDPSIQAAVRNSSTAIREWVVPNQQRRPPSSMTEYRFEQPPANSAQQSPANSAQQLPANSAQQPPAKRKKQ